MAMSKKIRNFATLNIYANKLSLTRPENGR